MALFDLDAWVARSGALDLDAIPWADVPKYELPEEAVRTLTYMQDIESHTIIYLRALLATRAVDDPEVATFLACWLHEETFHGIGLRRFLEHAGHPVGDRPVPRGQEPILKRLESWATSMVSKAWPDFCAVHMTWGAINELTTLTGYLRLKTVVRHPVLDELLEAIMRDESRHFFFYYRQAETRLKRPAVQRVARLLVDRFWAPVGSGVGSEEDLRFMARYLFAGPEGRAQARKVDDTLRKLPGFSDADFLEAWMDRHVGPTGPNGGMNGHGYN
jgi:hypothetical protein